MSFDFGSPMPLQEAVKFLSEKTPIGSVLRSREWAGMPAVLRRRGQFSAGVESARVLQRIQDALVEVITNARKELRADGSAPGIYKMDRAKFVAELQQLAVQEGLRPQDLADDGTLKDITSEARLDLIYRTQVQQARGHAYWKRGQAQAVLDGWPAQELVRVYDREEPRDWVRRWEEAGGEFYGGRMVALKTDPIWIRISRFEQPWPPFDFNSGMGVKEIDREEALGLGVLEAGEELDPMEEEFNANLEASAEGLSGEMKEALQAVFGEQIDVGGERVRWAANEAGGINTESTEDTEEFINYRPDQSRDDLGRWVDENGGGLSERHNIQRGTKAMRRALGQGRDVPKAMYRKGLGQIDFVWGTPGETKNDFIPGYGISHLLAKHGRREALMLPVALA